MILFSGVLHIDSLFLKIIPHFKLLSNFDCTPYTAQSILLLVLHIAVCLLIPLPNLAPSPFIYPLVCYVCGC